MSVDVRNYNINYKQTTILESIAAMSEKDEGKFSNTYFTNYESRERTVLLISGQDKRKQGFERLTLDSYFTGSCLTLCEILQRISAFRKQLQWPQA